MSAFDNYDERVKDLGTFDRRRFDAFLIGYLLNGLDAETWKAALDAAAANVNEEAYQIARAYLGSDA